ncbi:histidine phosphatase family protein [Alkalihalobacillus trypoxylicola]|uniref:Phosphoglycerate mutase n=1 Tax=Alkalihalobacillus trypoxylicola TaxID=519424 RepID=A0A161PMJ6_9BACI|nr:histidine phosphatase family protein [Alkalihalobacillus trypoxylicola]KYG35293.1 phosphoglycerate mutase [Alkalihalobacillus trypoxylicola]
MDQNIYIIRHCEAEGQSPESTLTEDGFNQANDLADFLSDVEVDRVISSPFLRALQTIQPFATNKNIEIEVDHRLSERILSSMHFSDWMDKLEATFNHMDLTYKGGESSNDAKKRMINVIHDIVTSQSKNSVIVAHGGVISLLLHHYDQDFGFKEWKGLSNPDVYVLRLSSISSNIKRIWID